jgi:NDP-sugar pyrophosphorylase family protein
MKAMVLAAGLGTRLRPLTDHRPKALVEVGGRTLLELTLTRLRSVGVTDVIVNVHHFPGMISDYLESNRRFGMRVEISREDVLLDTGGGLKNAAHFFLDGSSTPEEPFLVHNVDVISNIDLGRMLESHRAHQALATLAVQHRPSDRSLLFNQQLQLCGRAGDNPEIVRSFPQMQPLAFCGIHAVSPRLFSLLTEHGAFSIIASYLRLASQGASILGFPADEYWWRDVGRQESLAQAAQEVLDQRSSE